MNYMQNGTFQHHSLMRLTLGLAGIFLAGFVVTNFLLYFDRMGLNASSVVDYYRGSEEQFRPARSYASMLEVSHGHMAMMALVLLLLTHLVIFAPFSRRMKILFVVVPFAAGLLGEASSWLVRFVHAGFAPLKIVGFLLLQTSLIALLVSLARMLLVSPTARPLDATGSSPGKPHGVDAALEETR